ncbi:F-box/kelch-repeat protein At3g27150-like [Silene latifolia]|uniref:F-box/kelch-repeat protein At3g27150-like n=1 Tax=Silene latifolia TaxID=37657 RepID=UPI003D76F6FE
MSNGRGVERKEVDEEEVEGYEIDESEYEDEGDDYYEDDYDYESDLENFNEIDRGDAIAPCIVSDGSRPDKIRKRDTNPCLDRQWMLSGGHGGLDLNLDIECQDADYYSFPHFNLPRIPIEVETMIIARIPLLEIRRLCSLNKRILTLIKSGELVRERREIGVREASVFMLASGESNWWAFDQNFTVRKILPELPSDYTFRLADKESLCAGTHLLVFGKEMDGPAVWTYEVLVNKWFKSTSMVEPRCLFASASFGDFAYVAGGICPETKRILNSAEKYDPATRLWEPLPKMKEKRRMCAGVFMDNKFYVIGGQNQTGDAFTCAEVFDEKKNTWVKISGMLNGLTTSDSPPLVAVVNNELYTFETSTNCLMVYLKDKNSWKDLGPVPVRADIRRGWGVAFKSLGNELLAIGGSNMSPSGRGMTTFTCCPNPKLETMEWKLLDDGRNSRSAFVMNCTVMVA